MGYIASRGYRRELLFDDGRLKSESVPELAALINTWTGFLKGDEYRSRMERVLELVATHGVDRVLADVSRIRSLVSEDSAWTNEVWAPRAVAAGMRAMAVVLPSNVFAQLGVTRVVEKLGQVEMLTALFDDARDAQRWLESPEASGQTRLQNGAVGRAK
jgi:SpoIIAA-like